MPCSSRWAALLLLVHNVGFILPLLGVFVLVITATRSQTIAAVFNRHMAPAKVGLAAVFLALGTLAVLL